MKFQRALLLTDLLTDVRPAITALGRVAPELQHVLIVAALRNTGALAFFGTAAEPDEENLRSLDRLRDQAEAVARTSDVQFALDIEMSPLAQLGLDARIDLLVAGTSSLRDVSVLAKVQRRLGLPLLWPAQEDIAGDPIENVFCVPLGRAGRLSLAAFLRDHLDRSVNVTLLSPTPPAPDELSNVVEELSRTRATAQIPREGIASLRWLLTDEAMRPQFELLVLTRVPPALVFGINWPTPVLLLPPMSSENAARVRALDVVDAVDQLGPFDRPLVLFDCDLGDEALATLLRRDDADSTDLLAVRLRPGRDVREIRERLRALQLPTHVIDASALLDEGSALDVSKMIDPVRLGRVAARLRLAGLPIAGIFHRELSAWQESVSVTATPIMGNHIEIELDNAQARRWLLEAIGNSKHSVHLQVYMAADDEVGRAVETALGAAGERGVTVRVLVDSLHGRHGSFGTENSLLTRLSVLPGVELRISQPVNDLRSIMDLKQRDHRKLMVVDGQLTLVGGRNLAHEYYTAFDEAAITVTSPWREVPWLDAGARIAGPAVNALAASFREAWTDAGGADFAIESATPAGTSTARVVVHRGMRDACTLEAYLDLIDTAAAHIAVVNGFPLMLELQHALLRAHARGVHVRVLTGHVAPTYTGQPFAGPWAGARSAATELVHSRLDPLVEAGADVYSFAKQDVPGWDPALGRVHPHVHAKVMSVDGKHCTVGSANFDITSSYWESELILVVDDPALTQALNAQLDVLFATSIRWNREDHDWQRLANRRAWLRHWPGVLSL